MKKSSKIFIAGHNGLVGSAILERFRFHGFSNIVTRSRKQLDLTNQQSVKLFFENEKPDCVILAAAKVGGIKANSDFRADFIYENLMIQTNVIYFAFINNVKSLLFLGSTCVYPRECPQPIKEKYLLTSQLEKTNESYAVAKIAGLKMCESYNFQYNTNFISIMPTNIYGIKDNFDLETSHVLPAIFRKVYLSKLLYENEWDKLKYDLKKRPIGIINEKSSKKEINRVLEEKGITKQTVMLWGSGNPKREFLWSDDLADACLFLIKQDHSKKLSNFDDLNSLINIGTGTNISIIELALKIKRLLNYKGDFIFDHSKPDGTPVKLTDISKMSKLGWKHKIDLDTGIKKMYDWYKNE